MSREAMQQALDALERYEYAEARKALRAALEPVQPVADLVTYGIAITKDGERVDPKDFYKAPDPVSLPCCGYSDPFAVMWNQYNKVVQCHNCGQVYNAAPPEGYVMAPVDANDAILQAAVSVLGGGHVNTDVVRDVYKAMLSAAKKGGE